jgi:hypothetical protein
MFGLENEKKKEAPTSFLFDLEKELGSDQKKAALVKRLEVRIATIKEQLKGGSTKGLYDTLGTLLNGYHALAIVLSRATKEFKPAKK